MIQTTTPSVDGRTIFDCETVGNGSMLMVTASGTAVRLGA